MVQGAPGRKSIRRNEMHEEFETLLRNLTPTGETVDLATIIFREAWEKRSSGVHERIAQLHREAKEMDKSIGLLVDRVANASNPQLISVYEKRLVELQRDRAALVEKMELSAKPLPDFDSTLRTALVFLASPWKLWETGTLEDRRAVRKLVFTEHLQYAPELGFRTAETTLPFKLLAEVESQNNGVVRVVGIEPTLCHQNWILNPARLPVPPHPHIAADSIRRTWLLYCT